MDGWGPFSLLGEHGVESGGTEGSGVGFGASPSNVHCLAIRMGIVSMMLCGTALLFPL